jgi:hypothetical protein
MAFESRSLIRPTIDGNGELAPIVRWRPPRPPIFEEPIPEPEPPAPQEPPRTTVGDRLRAGQKLEPNQQLVSANGRYTLLMQTDGNLVLYNGAPAIATAYWATGTEWLPQDQRPTSVVMQSDAHLVLYDAGGVARWGSGTWGGFVDPYVVLQDDGNLVVFHDGSTPVWATGGPGGHGRIPAIGHVAAPQTLDHAVDQCGRMPEIVTGAVPLDNPTTTTVDANGVAYHVTEQRRRLVNDVIEHAFLQDIAGMGVWPGQVIQGRSLTGGDVAPIGPFPRMPGTVNLVTDVITGSPAPQSAKVESPNAASVDQVRRDMLRALNPADSPGLLKADFQRASTFREVGVKVGVSVKGSAFGVDANATLDQTYKQSTVVAVIRQVFYTATFTPDGPRAGGMWPKGTPLADLTRYMGPGNPPLYIDSVQYGRFICVTAQGAFSSSEITAALKAQYNATVNVSGSLDARSKEVLESSQVKIYTIGVPGRSNFQNITDPLAELQQVYRSGLTFSLENPGAPISFTCRHITDGTLAHVGLAADYVQPLSAQGQNVADARYQMYDGPGGGLVDTGIRVNPKDRVTISAGGQISSGVVLSWPHGPEGWRGHKADPHAPLPSGTAYCLVARFGSHPAAWFEVGPFWEGSPSTTFYGRLQLNINDNNTQNGSRNDQWTVRVDVERAGAAAAGVFI